MTQKPAGALPCYFPGAAGSSQHLPSGSKYRTVLSWVARAESRIVSCAAWQGCLLLLVALGEASGLLVFLGCHTGLCLCSLCLLCARALCARLIRMLVVVALATWKPGVASLPFPDLCLQRPCSHTAKHSQGPGLQAGFSLFCLQSKDTSTA